MCGIVGYVGQNPAQPILIDGLQKLEYRGYDSAGIATIDANTTHVRRAAGKLVNLRQALAEQGCVGHIGIGHTRWATHGAPNEQNAHPHHIDGITVVHNGIIENHTTLREQLMAKGHTFASQTDTEIFAHLISVERKKGLALLPAIQAAIKHVEGAFAIAVSDETTPDQVGFAKQASPLVVGLGQGESFLASDIPAVLAHTRRFIFLEDGDCGVIERESLTIETLDGEPVERQAKDIHWSPVMAEKGGHKHFMHKEIFEQPRAITDTLRGRLLVDQRQVVLDDVDTEAMRDIRRIVIIACGTSWHAGLVGQYLIEDLARVSVQVDLASEFRYRNPVVDDTTLVIAISQSGETADTLAALKEAKSRGAKVMAVCNVIDSAIPRTTADSCGTVYTRAGPEIGVASTKAFTTQLVALHLIALFLAQARQSSTPDVIASEIEALVSLPRLIEDLLQDEDPIRDLAQGYVGAKNMLYLGRGLLFPIALEGALKLKEISYIHAEGYAAGEMKHGPIALIDEEMPVIVLAVKGPGYEKVVSNLEEVRARGGKVLSVGVEGDDALSDISEATMGIPAAPPNLLPVLATIPLQLFSYHVADIRGTDVDQPRNLAKSVTVE